MPSGYRTGDMSYRLADGAHRLVDIPPSLIHVGSSLHGSPRAPVPLKVPGRFQAVHGEGDGGALLVRQVVVGAAAPDRLGVGAVSERPLMVDRTTPSPASSRNAAE